MKKIVFFIIISLFPVCMFGQTGEEIFDANFNVKNTFIDTFFIEKNVVLTPYVFQSSKPLFTNNWGSFSLNLYKFNGYEHEPGYNVIDILKNGASILSLKSSNGFEAISSYVKSETGFCAVSFLDANTVALIFNEYIYESSPYMASIVIIRDVVAKLVYNKPMYINSIQYSPNFSMELQANTIEYTDSNTPINQPELHTVWWDGSTLRYK